MSKVFLASRVLVMLALIILIMACFWGWTHRTTAQPIPEQSLLERYDSKKPGPVITSLFIGSIFLGLFVIAASIWIEYKRVQELEKEALSQSYGEQAPGDQQYYNL
jgi:hypothetical protein